MIPLGFATVHDMGPDDKPSKEIRGYLRTCLSAVESPSTAKFVESLAKQWDTKKYLTGKQICLLKQIHDEL